MRIQKNPRIQESTLNPNIIIIRYIDIVKLHLSLDFWLFWLFWILSGFYINLHYSFSNTISSAFIFKPVNTHLL